MQMKLLDYGKLNPFGDTVGGVRHLAWPVNAYRVTLPKSSDDGDGLNPFERVVLKLLNAVGAMTDRALADETCIPLDLVKGILCDYKTTGSLMSTIQSWNRTISGAKVEKRVLPSSSQPSCFVNSQQANSSPFCTF